ncbi:sugar ABC transporter permease [Bacillus velezensis]|uniref:sugar ABC transporter permease n=1 Tax=Bacillus velezensis TaxID=492670 RepID=UPI0031363AB8
MKNVWVAGILSFLLPGLGHLYLGQVFKGFILIILNAIFILLSSSVIGILGFLIVWLYAVINSIRRVKVFNSNLNQ